MVIIFINLKKQYLTHFTSDPYKGGVYGIRGSCHFSPKLHTPPSCNVENSNQCYKKNENSGFSFSLAVMLVVCTIVNPIELVTPCFSVFDHLLTQLMGLWNHVLLLLLSAGQLLLQISWAQVFFQTSYDILFIKIIHMSCAISAFWQELTSFFSSL